MSEKPTYSIKTQHIKRAKAILEEVVPVALILVPGKTKVHVISFGDRPLWRGLLSEAYDQVFEKQEDDNNDESQED